MIRGFYDHVARNRLTEKKRSKKKLNTHNKAGILHVAEVLLCFFLDPLKMQLRSIKVVQQSIDQLVWFPVQLVVS